MTAAANCSGASWCTTCPAASSTRPGRAAASGDHVPGVIGRQLVASCSADQQGGAGHRCPVGPVIAVERLLGRYGVVDAERETPALIRLPQRALQIRCGRPRSLDQPLLRRRARGKARGKRPVAVHDGADVVHDQPADLLRVPGGELVGVHPTERVTQHRHRTDSQMRMKRDDIGYVVVPLIADGRVRLSVTALVERDHPPPRRQRLRERGERRRLVVVPVQPQAACSDHRSPEATASAHPP